MAETLVEERSSGSLYDRIREDIESNVMSGQWSPGYRIPYEHELMTEYGCSRMTVNRALATLVERGLIERRKRAGSFVLAPKSHRAFFELPEMRRHVIDQGKKYDFDLLKREVRSANAKDRSFLNISKAEVLQLDCVHYADGKPFSLEHRIINLELAPEAKHADFTQEPPSSWLFAHVPWSDAHHTISAVNADPEAARHLSVRDDCACLVVERWTWRTAEKITYVRMTHPSNMFSIEAAFRA